MARTTSASTKCLVCSNTVRFDNPTFPYCRYHVGIKEHYSTFDEQIRNAKDDKERKTLIWQKFVPEFTNLTRRQSDDTTVSSIAKMDYRDVRLIHQVWSRSTRGQNMMIPSIAARGAEGLTERMQKVMAKKYGQDRSEIVNLTGGDILGTVLYEDGVKIGDDDSSEMIYSVDKSMPVSDHMAVVLRDEQGEITHLVDCATTAPLADLVGEGEEIPADIMRRSTTIGDLMNIMPMVEYMLAGDVSWSKMSAQDGTVLFNNVKNIEMDDYESQRELIRNSPPIAYRKPVPLTGKAIYGENPDEAIRKSNEADFDELVAQDASFLNAYR